MYRGGDNSNQFYTEQNLRHFGKTKRYEIIKPRNQVQQQCLRLVIHAK